MTRKMFLSFVVGIEIRNNLILLRIKGLSILKHLIYGLSKGVLAILLDRPITLGHSFILLFNNKFNIYILFIELNNKI